MFDKIQMDISGAMTSVKSLIGKLPKEPLGRKYDSRFFALRATGKCKIKLYSSFGTDQIISIR